MKTLSNLTNMLLLLLGLWPKTNMVLVYWINVLLHKRVIYSFTPLYHACTPCDVIFWAEKCNFMNFNEG